MILYRAFRTIKEDATCVRDRVRSFHRTSRLVATMLVVFASPLVSSAQTTHFTSTIWRSQDGLPENIVQALLQDREGYLWVGTTGGLTRFDGARFSPVNDGTTPTLSVNSFFCLLLSRD